MMLMIFIMMMLTEEKNGGGSERRKEMSGEWEGGRIGKNVGGIKHICVSRKSRKGGGKGETKEHDSLLSSNAMVDFSFEIALSETEFGARFSIPVKHLDIK